MDGDIVSEKHCIGDIASNSNSDDHGGEAVAARSVDATPDDTVDTSTPDTSIQPVGDTAAAETDLGSKTATSEDEVQTDASVKDDDGKLDGKEQPAGNDVDNKSMWYFADIKKHWRKFNVDLMPKVIKGHCDHPLPCSSNRYVAEHTFRSLAVLEFVTHTTRKWYNALANQSINQSV